MRSEGESDHERDVECPIYDGRYVHRIFEKCVERSPDSIALISESEVVSYAELNQRSERLARSLRHLGIRPDDRVAVCTDRCAEMIVAVLAVLKAGGAYVPLDPAYPDDRLRYMICDSAPKAILLSAYRSGSRSHEPTRVREWSLDVPIIDVTSAIDSWTGESGVDPESHCVDLTTTHLAYVIYTSGSTGTPKGVMVEHAGLCNLITAQIRAFRVRHGSRVLQFASFSFDASVSEVFMALCSGACLVLVPDVSGRTGDELVSLVNRHRISHLTLPPAVLATLPNENCLESVETLILAGDALSGSLAEKWRGSRRLFNAYGPTENTVCATLHECHPSDGTAAPPIGRPIANTSAYILDQSLCPVGVGIVGELFLGGVQVARGYINKPEVTAERFIIDPFDSVPGRRMYRTGDLCRYRADGSIEFVGRADFQVKIRGYRVELGEIEARVRTCPGIRDAVVVADNTPDGGKRLVAYYSVGDHATAHGVPVDVRVVRAHVASALPEYMVPAVYVLLQALPLTPSGKLDRAALPPADAAAYATSDFEPPVGEVEEALARIWTRLLQIERVGRNDDFFSLGGHSLLAVQLARQIEQDVGCPVEMKAIFELRTLAKIASTMTHAHYSSAYDTASHSGSAEPAYPVRAARTVEEFYYWAADRGGFRDPWAVAFVVDLGTRFDLHEMCNAVGAVVAAHDLLRCNLVPRDRQLFITMREDGIGELNVLDMSGLSPTEVEPATQRVMRELFYACARIDVDPLAQFTVVRLPTHDVLHVRVEHIIFDLRSQYVVADDLVTSYLTKQKLPDRSRFAQFSNVEWANLAKTDVLERSERYWKRAFTSALPPASLPGDVTSFYSVANPDTAVAIEIRSLDTFRNVQREARTTPFALVLAGLHAFLREHTGVCETHIETRSNRRTRAEWDRTVGFFATNLVLPIRSDATDGPLEIIDKCKGTWLGAFEHQDISYFRHKTIANPHLSMNAYHWPIMLTQQRGAFEAALEIRFSALGVKMRSANFGAMPHDVMIFLADHAERIELYVIFNGRKYSRELATDYAAKLESSLDMFVHEASSALQRLKAS